MDASEFDRKYSILDTITPRKVMLSARYKRSFAYYTIRERLPVILTQILDNLTRDKDEIADKFQGEETREEIKNIIGQISKLKYQLQTDKPFEHIEGQETDQELWNSFLDTLPSNYCSFFQSAWLYAECYMYRKVASFFESSNTINTFDYFFKQKDKSLRMEEVVGVAKRLRNTERDLKTFSRMLKLNLWGNKCDLSIVIPTNFDPNKNVFDHTETLDGNILVDNTNDIWNCLTSADQSKPVIVDFVLDNAGFEFYTDLVLADYLLDKQLAKKVRFHVKSIPWFVSDVTPNDFHYTFEYLSNHSSDYVSEQGRKWKQYVVDRLFELAPVNSFWSSPYEYYKMIDLNPALYKQLQESSLIIFKGDLNYRKLLGDFNWDFTESFQTCLRGFFPTNLCTLRTVKSDIICDLHPGKAEELCRKDAKWMETGEYGVIQFMEGNDCGCQKKSD